MSGPVVLAVAGLTVACSVTAMITRRSRLGGSALAGVGAGAGILLVLSGEPGLGVAAIAGTWVVAVAFQLWGREVSRAAPSGEADRKRAPRLVALLSISILVASLGLGIAAVDWVDAPRRPQTEREESSVGVWPLALLGLAAVLGLVRIAAPRLEER